MFNRSKINTGRPVVVLSLDGVPYTFLKARIEAGELPNLAGLFKDGSKRRMNSVQPCISSVAWASYLTGKNPGKHHIYGFIDKKPHTFDLYVPTASHMRGDTILDLLSRAGKRVFMMNVPVTYPPRRVNGVLIGCFLCSRLEQIAYPANISEELKDIGYKIDADAKIARQDLDQYLKDCNEALEKRAEALFHFLKREPWDFFQCHIMETDRMNHFFWSHMEENDPRYAKAVLDFYRRVDQIVGEVAESIGSEAQLILLSDHGFCSIDKEIYLNYYLAEAGLLKLRTSQPRSISDMHPDSMAYSLIPGRVFINLKGREPNGSVQPEQYEDVRELVKHEMMAMRDPESCKPIIRSVLKREEVYTGADLTTAADLIAVPHDGYDLKSDIRKMMPGERTALVGMHTFDDSFLFVRDRDLRCADNELWIGDVGPTILDMMSIPAPSDMDGVSLLAH
ncbi:MAG TPA: alkaline phosphatase family protein [Terriglobia bacterium]|nr:alkaline phosphatase family protein [Terriglobia bacterium]